VPAKVPVISRVRKVVNWHPGWRRGGETPTSARAGRSRGGGLGGPARGRGLGAGAGGRRGPRSPGGGLASAPRDGV